MTLEMKITFENIMEKVVNNRMMSRKDKQNAIREFLKENSGVNKPTNPEQITILETVKAIRKSYSAKDTLEKGNETANKEY